MAPAGFSGIHMTWNSIKQFNDFCSNNCSSLGPVLYLSLTIIEILLQKWWRAGGETKYPLHSPALVLSLVFWIFLYLHLLCFSSDWKRARTIFLLICKVSPACLWTTQHHSILLSTNPQGAAASLQSHGSFSRITIFILCTAQVTTLATSSS